jgi:hypothetical protein
MASAVVLVKKLIQVDALIDLLALMEESLVVLVNALRVLLKKMAFAVAGHKMLII